MTAYNIVGASTLVAGQPEDVSQVLANFQAIQAILNGGIDNANLKAAANIQLSQLGQSGASTSQVATWNGSTWVPGTPSAGGGGGAPTGAAGGGLSGSYPNPGIANGAVGPAQLTSTVLRGMRLEAGRVGPFNVPANGSNGSTVSFAAAFGATPAIVIGWEANGDPNWAPSIPRFITGSANWGFSWSCSQGSNGAANVYFSWIAMGA